MQRNIYMVRELFFLVFFFSSRRRHTRSDRDWSSDVCSSDLLEIMSAACEIEDCGSSTTASNFFCPIVASVCSTLEATDRKSTRLNSSHDQISYAVFCLKKKSDSIGTGTRRLAGKIGGTRSQR